MRVHENGTESSILDGTDDMQRMDSHEPILHLRSLLIESPIFSKCSNHSLDGSSSPSTTCSTTSIDESGLAFSMSSQDSVASSVPDEHQNEDSTADSKEIINSSKQEADFFALRITYLLVTLVIMLADGLQGKALHMLHSFRR